MDNAASMRANQNLNLIAWKKWRTVQSRAIKIDGAEDERPDQGAKRPPEKPGQTEEKKVSPRGGLQWEKSRCRAEHARHENQAE